MKNKKDRLVAGILLIASAVVLFTAALIRFIQSFEKYDDGYGMDLGFDSDHLIMMITSTILIVYFSCELYHDMKKTPNPFTATYALLFTSAIISFYATGTFLKPLLKAVSKGTEFHFYEFQVYFYSAIFGFVLLAYSLVRYFSEKKRTN